MIICIQALKLLLLKQIQYCNHFSENCNFFHVSYFNPENHIFMYEIYLQLVTEKIIVSNHITSVCCMNCKFNCCKSFWETRFWIQKDEVKRSQIPSMSSIIWLVLSYDMYDCGSAIKILMLSHTSSRHFISKILKILIQFAITSCEKHMRNLGAMLSSQGNYYFKRWWWSTVILVITMLQWIKIYTLFGMCGRAETKLRQLLFFILIVSIHALILYIQTSEMY